MTASPKPTPVAMSKTVTGSGLTDQQWEQQNSTLNTKAAAKAGKCWQCAGEGRLFHAFGGEQRVVVCGICNGTGKSIEKASA